MVPAIPTVEVYYIALKKDDAEQGSKAQAALGSLSTVGQWLGKIPVAGSTALLGELGMRAVVELKRLYEDGRFKVIQSEQELAGYENANGNAWVMKDKALSQRQYYIRHPKLKNRKLLIEAKDFQSYIEEEQKDELLDFIFSHCSPKSITIDRVEEKTAKSNAGGKIPTSTAEMDISAGMDFKSKKGNYYNFQNPNGAPRKQPRESYLWLEPSLMRSIEALTAGASLTQSYERDFTFGLTAKEAKTVGLSLEGHKKYLYRINIEC